MPPPFNHQGAVTFRGGRGDAAANPAGGAGDIVLVESEAMLAEALQQAIAGWFRAASCRVFELGEPGLAHCLARPPALVILDLVLPDMDGREFVRRARMAGVDAPILLLANAVDWRLAAELRTLGANGYVAKGVGLRPVEEAVRQLLAGSAHARVGEVLIEGYKTRDEVQLTQRQLEVATAVARGLSSREIAESLGLSPRTVETYRAQAMVKLRVSDTASLVRWCVKQGLV